jgi:hypothetical protein
MCTSSSSSKRHLALLASSNDLRLRERDDTQAGTMLKCIAMISMAVFLGWHARGCDGVAAAQRDEALDIAHDHVRSTIRVLLHSRYHLAVHLSRN